MWCSGSDLEILSPVFSSGYFKREERIWVGDATVQGESESYASVLHVSSMQYYDIRYRIVIRTELAIACAPSTFRTKH